MTHANHQGEPGDTALERVRHLKRGTEYEVLGEAEAQISTRYESDRFGNWIGLYEGHTLVVYRCVETGKLWCRPPEEFRDGRFQTIASAPTPPVRVGEEVGREDSLTVYSNATDRAWLTKLVGSDVDGERLARVITDASQWAEYVASAPSPDPAGAGGGLRFPAPADEAKKGGWTIDVAYLTRLNALARTKWDGQYGLEETEALLLSLDASEVVALGTEARTAETFGLGPKDDGPACKATPEATPKSSPDQTPVDPQMTVERAHVVSARLIPWEPGSLGGVDLTFESGLRVALPLSEPETVGPAIEDSRLVDATSVVSEGRPSPTHDAAEMTIEEAQEVLHLPPWCGPNFLIDVCRRTGAHAEADRLELALRTLQAGGEVR